MATYWDELKDLVIHPIDSLAALLAPPVSVSGGPSLGGSLITTVQETPPSDSISSAAVRAYGVDPVSGAIIAPQYLANATANGYSLSDPMAFVRKVSEDARKFYDRQYIANLADDSPFNPGSPSGLLLIVVVAVLAVLLFKAVK